MFAGKKSAQIREILINESAWEEMTCLFAPSLDILVAGDYHSAIHNLEILKAELLRQVAESTPDIPKAPWEI